MPSCRSASNTCGDPFYIEEQLDVEASYDMAPGANQLVVGGDSCNNGDFGLQGLFNADIAVLNGTGRHPLATVASNSWGARRDAAAELTRIETPTWCARPPRASACTSPPATAPAC